MIRKLLIRDLTLRDGQQSAFATRMSQAQIDRVLPYYKDAGFYAMEVWGGAVPDSVMRYLGENPWDRLEIIKEKIGNSSKLSALSRGRTMRMKIYRYFQALLEQSHQFRRTSRRYQTTHILQGDHICAQRLQLKGLV